MFPLQRLIGSPPQATIFQGAFCLMLYNLMQAVRQHVAAAQPQPCAPDSLSTEEIFRDVTRQLICVTELIPPAELAAMNSTDRTADELKQYLAERLRHPIPKLWKKTTNKRHRKKTPTKKQSGAHTSVERLLNPKTKNAES